MNLYVLDSYPIFAYLLDEASADKFLKILENAKGGKAKLYMSWLTLTEIFFFLKRKRGSTFAHEVLGRLKSWPLEWVPVEENIALLAGEFKSQYALSLADSLVAATAKTKGAKILTGDRVFRQLENNKEVEIEWIG